MSTEDTIEIERGTGNVYADLGFANAELLQVKASIAAEIIKTLDARKLTVTQAANLTGIDAGDYSRVRRARFERLSVDRLLRMTERLGRHSTIRFSAATKMTEASVHI